MTSSAPDLFGRNIAAMVTPMLPDGSLDLASIHALVDQLVRRGCDGLVVCGTTGEAPTLSDEELAVVVRAAVQAAAGRARVTAGVGTNDTRHAVRLAGAVAEAGADALLVLAPYYSRPTQRGIVAHVQAVLERVELPVMLYDVPARTGVEISPESFRELARHPRVRAVKDSRGDLEVAALTQGLGLDTYCGIDDLNLAYLATGAVGLVSVVTNLHPEVTARLIAAVDAGDLLTARRLVRALRPWVRHLADTSQGAIVAKAALARSGVIAHPTVRLPLVEDPDEVVTRLDDLVAPHLAAAPGR